MSDLTEFLLARIGEDEAEASRVWDALGEDWRGFAWPLRVLAECEAHRRIVSRCDMVLRGREHGMFSEGQRVDANDNLRALATIWADHPDFRQEWKP